MATKWKYEAIQSRSVNLAIHCILVCTYHSLIKWYRYPTHHECAPGPKLPFSWSVSADLSQYHSCVKGGLRFDPRVQLHSPTLCLMIPNKKVMAWDYFKVNLVMGSYLTSRPFYVFLLLNKNPGLLLNYLNSVQLSHRLVAWKSFANRNTVEYRIPVSCHFKVHRNAKLRDIYWLYL